MPGFPVNRFVDLNESQAKHFLCNICKNIFNNAVRLECEHTFCKDCLQERIANDCKECPECHYKFSLKRNNKSRDEPNSVIISNFVFKSHLMVNNFIKELKIKCDFESNGCPESVELGLLDDHIIDCVHKFCVKCKYPLGKSRRHDCVEVLRKALNQKSTDFVQQLEKSKEIIEKQNLIIKSQKKEIQDCLRGLLSMGQRLFASIEYILIGTYKSTVLRLELNHDHIKFISIPTNNEALKKKYHITLPFTEILDVMYCMDPSLLTLFVLIDSDCCHKIQDSFYLGDNSPNEHKFDVHSNGLLIDF